MAIDKIIPRSLNNDDDFLLVKSTEMVDALNVSVSTDNDGDAGVIKRAYGNELVSFANGSALPSGTNKVVGSCINREKNEILYSVYNTNNNHSIYLYSVASNTLSLVFRDTVLGFTANGWVKMDTIVKEDGDTLLYLNDGITDPKKINATKAISSLSYPYTSLLDLDDLGLIQIYNYTAEDKLLSITLAKQPPLIPPLVSFTNDASVSSNRLRNRYFIFCYQYIYEDGERSTLSPYSSIALNSSLLSDGISAEEYSNSFNAIDVVVNRSIGDVSKIAIYASELGTQAFFLVKEIDNVRSILYPTESVRFFNNQHRQFIQERVSRSLFDNVPLSSLSQAIVANRLVYGGNKESYDNVQVGGVVNLNYQLDSEPTISVTPDKGSPVSESGSDFDINIDLSSLPPSSSKALDVFFDINISSAMRVNYPWTDLNPSPSSVPYFELEKIDSNVVRSINVPPYQNRSQLSGYLSSSISGIYDALVTDESPWEVSSTFYRTSGTAKIEVFFGSFASNLLQMKFKVSRVSVKIVRSSSPSILSSIIDADVSNTTQNVFGYFNINKSRIFDGQSSSFKRNEEHQFGVVYYDSRGRSGAVNKLGSAVPISFQSLSIGRCSASVRITSTPPSWARRWQLVYSPFNTYSFSYTYSVAEAFTTETSGESFDRRIYLSIRHLQGKEDSYSESTGAIFDYSFVEGDRLRILSRGTSVGRIPVNLEFEVIGLESFDTANTLVFPSSGVSDERKTGLFLVIKDPKYSQYSAADISAGISEWGSNVIVEIFRLSKSSENKVYYEISESHPVVYDQSTQQWMHRGQRDFTFSTILSLPQNYLSVSVVPILNIRSCETAVDVRRGDVLRVVVDEGTGETADITVDNEFAENQFFSHSTSIPSGSFRIQQIMNIRDAVVDTSNGDVYFRPRKIKMNQIVNGVPSPSSEVPYFESHYVEDNSISDFRRSQFISIGRANSESTDIKQTTRKATLTWSDPYALDTSNLGLSTFNLSDANFSDLQAEHGAIRYIASNSDSIMVLQETKCSVLPISRNVIEYADGSSSVTISNNFVGQQNFYAGDFGVGDHPESVAQYYGKVFFADHRTGKVIRISADGIELISSQGMEAYFENAFEDVNKFGSSNFKIYGGIDPRSKEYVISIQKISGEFAFENKTAAYSIEDKVWTTRYSFMPEAMSEINGEFYTMRNGSMYRHSFDAPRCSFYGQDYPSKLSVISSQNNSMVKVFNAISQESTAPWSFSCETSDQQTPTVQAENMEKKENFYYHNIPTDIDRLSISGVGVVTSVASVSAGVIRVGFSSSVIYLPIAAGALVYKMIGAVATLTDRSVSSVSGNKEITMSGTEIISVGDVIAVASSDAMAVNGDPLRGPYMKIDMEISGVDDSELYSVNTWFSRSATHNEMTN